MRHTGSTERVGVHVIVRGVFERHPDTRCRHAKLFLFSVVDFCYHHDEVCVIIQAVNPCVLENHRVIIFILRRDKRHYFSDKVTEVLSKAIEQFAPLACNMVPGPTLH